MQHRSSSSKKDKSPSRNTTTNDKVSEDSQLKSKTSKLLMGSSSSQNLARVFAAAALYVLSGSTQPLLMTLVKQSGLGDPTCQLYMLFYYLGPALVSLSFCIPSSLRRSTDNGNNSRPASTRPSRNALIKSAGIASIDIVAQAMNYTGSTFCGPTIFAIIYSSVTIWTALFSRMILARTLNRIQWMGVCVVFGGLSITAWDSAALGPEVLKGAVLVFMGSTVHAMTYVLSEAIMTKGSSGANDNDNDNEHGSSDSEQLGVTENCAVQGIVACFVYLTWQCVYTLPRFQERIVQPAQQSGTSLTQALLILGGIGGSNLVHALSFFYTLKCFPGGATSAGVMKGLQAVLVFVFTSVVYCDKSSDSMGEMCFTKIKFISLVVVVGGVMLFAIGTDSGRKRSIMNDDESRNRRGYAAIGADNHNHTAAPTTS